jgi:hypothetical protein
VAAAVNEKLNEVAVMGPCFAISRYDESRRMTSMANHQSGRRWRMFQVRVAAFTPEHCKSG